MLYRRNLYTLAVTLARSSGLSESGISEIYRRYGDHLYTKGDFDGAMEQYVKTLGHLQPSYVIRKVRDFFYRADDSTSTLSESTTSSLTCKNCTRAISPTQTILLSY